MRIAEIVNGSNFDSFKEEENITNEGQLENLDMAGQSLKPKSQRGTKKRVKKVARRKTILDDDALKITRGVDNLNPEFFHTSDA